MSNLTGADRCPKCKSEDVYTRDIEDVPTDPQAECGEGICEACDYTGPESEFWPTREELGLSPTNCECCHRTLTWGCGHSYEQEVAAIAHRQTTDHLLGDCDCYVSRPGYMAYVTREERRDGIAAVLREVRRLMDTTPGGTLTIDAGDTLPALMDRARIY